MTREYSSPLREEQVKATRERILQAMVELLAKGGNDLVIKQVAERADVSLRTVHHHFPDTESRVKALAQYIDERATKSDPGPECLHDLGDWAERMCSNFFSNEAILRAQLAPGLGEAVRRERKSQRSRKIRRELEAEIGSRKAAKELQALLDSVLRAESLIALRDEHQVSAERTTVLMRWLTEQIAGAVQRGELP